MWKIFIIPFFIVSNPYCIKGEGGAAVAMQKRYRACSPASASSCRKDLSLKLSKTSSGDLKKIPLSENQIRGILHSFMHSFESIEVQTSKDRYRELTIEQAIDLLVRNMSRESILDFIHQLNIIRERRSSVLAYVKYILTALVVRLEQSGKRDINRYN